MIMNMYEVFPHFKLFHVRKISLHKRVNNKQINQQVKLNIMRLKVFCFVCLSYLIYLFVSLLLLIEMIFICYLG